MSGRFVRLAPWCGVSLLLLLVAAAPPAAAQQATPVVGVSRVLYLEADAEAPLPIQVGPLDAIPRQSFLRLRGLPTSATLSEGYAISPGVWAVPMAGLPTLKIQFSGTAAGRFDVAVTLLAVDGRALAESQMSIVLTDGGASAARPASHPLTAASAAELPARATPPATALSPDRSVAAAAAAPPPAVPPARVAPARPPVDAERARRHVLKGDQLLQEGDIAAARLFYQRAVDLGWGPAALALGATYDPAELPRLNVRGLVGDAGLARRWYEAARTLGAPEADARLRRLAGR
jgi:hypothetical protein